jgi:hypothetical protein
MMNTSSDGIVMTGRRIENRTHILIAVAPLETRQLSS